jgi:thiol-disulfide isomerase/thioredoxin
VRAALALVLAAVLALTGCTADDLPSADAKVDVDTPALQQAKEKAGVEPCVEGDGDGTAVDGGLPAVSLACFGGGSALDLSTLRGPMVVNLWGYWCGPCRDELPILAKFYADHGDRVAMLGVDYQDVQVDDAMALVAKAGVTYPLVADPDGDLSGRAPFGPIRGLPISVFVAEDGTATVVPVVIESEDQLADLVEQHLGIRL